MPVYRSGMVSVFVVFWCLMCISAVEHKPKSVVLSYASASHPHVATLSHHYRAPPGPEPELQQHLPPSAADYSQLYDPPSAVHNGILPHSAAQNIPSSLPPSAGQSYTPEIYPQNVQQQGGHLENDGISHYDDRTSDIYQQPISSPTPIYDYEYTTAVSPINIYESSPVVYHNHQSLDNHNYHSYSTTEPPLNYDHYRLNEHSTVPPDLGYHSTPIYYNFRPPDEIPNIQPPSHDHPQGYDYSSTGRNHPTEQYHGVLENTYHHSLPSQHSHEQQFHEYTTPQPIYRNNNSPIHHESPQNVPVIGNTYQPESNLTHPPRSNQYYNSDGPINQNFPDYQAPASPEYFDSSSFHPHRGGKTFSPLPPSSTQVYYEDENEYISTTPIIDFESVKEKLPPIEDYPPPKPGYITKPFRNSFNQKTKMERQEQHKRGPSKASDKSSILHHTNDKVLQKPKYFAYSTDLLDNHDGTDGGIDQENRSDENNEDDHEQKNKDEKYAKGGGQEHNSGHEATAGDKGDKGYKSGHKHEEGKKGHHKKEDHKGKYLDEKGKKGKKEEEGGHYGENHKAEKGKKAAKFGESGEHKKGHSTKGEHNIHKMNEYMKKHEFYDEHHEGGDHEKHGGFMEAHAHKKGGKKKKGHHKGGHHQKHKGKKGHHEKGHKLGHHKGHKDAKGYDGHFSKHKKYGKKGGSKKGKKWGYSKGHPPK